MTTEQDLRWERIQETRERDPNTREAKPGSAGKALMRHHNGIIDRVAVLTRDRNFNVEVQRMTGGQVMTVRLDVLRTEKEVMEILKKKYPQHVPSTKPNPRSGEPPTPFNPMTLPRPVVDDIWGVK